MPRWVQIDQAQATLNSLNNTEAGPFNDPATVKVLARGDVRKEGKVVAPRGLAAIKTIDADFGLEPNATDHDRRLKLAQWITHSDNPLFPRVIANRVWQYHFGSGIVTTPNDFGFNGGEPTHPELDWLATDLQANGWSLKHTPANRVLRNLSAVIEMNRKHAQVDSDNRDLWRWSPTSLEGEVA